MATIQGLASLPTIFTNGTRVKAVNTLILKTKVKHQLVIYLKGEKIWKDNLYKQNENSKLELHHYIHLFRFNKSELGAT